MLHSDRAGGRRVRLRDAENLRLDCLPGWGSGAGDSLCGFYPRIIKKKKKKCFSLETKLQEIARISSLKKAVALQLLLRC